MDLEEEIIEYLEAHHVLTLATHDEVGPWATPLFYVSDEAMDLYFLSDPATRHCQAIKKRPGISAAIHGGSTAWMEITGLQLDGWACALEDEIEEQRAIALYIAKFPFVPPLIPQDGPHRVYRIHPRWIRLIDNSKGLGFKEEFNLDAGDIR
jgi:uncharacterized protein YhbP (UPF0306 family)